MKGWSEGDCIPFRYSVENKGSRPEMLDLELVFDSELDGTRGIVGFESFAVPGGSVYGPDFDGDEVGHYRWVVTVPKGATYVLEWCARLSDEAGLWPGASLHVSAKDGGSRDVPIMTKDLLVPDLAARATAIAECGQITYSIHFSNVGSADQRNVTLVDDYDETKVVVTDDGGGEDDGDAITWLIGDLPRGDEGNVSYTVRLKDGVDDGDTIASSGFVSGDLSEKIIANNRYLIQVAVKFGPEADAGPDRSITLGDSVVIGGMPAATSGSGGYTYIWGPATGLDDPAKPNPVASPSSTTNYTLTVTDESGCAESDDVRVTVTEPVLCGISGPDSVCDDQPVATFYYVGEDLLVSLASFEFTWRVDGMEVGSGEEVSVDWSRFEFGRHDLDLEIVKESPDGTIATGGCKLWVLYVESPTASIIML
ncbi:MAG: hypothetical protein APR56_00010 [Methanosaeta sp. SDB]|nr:MAG: hypothetical protein APR56_00010 [Methanosaeta sp. SDB]